ncbi:MAG: Ig-like domain-containing protein [Eubacteriales bacterium]|nr:Ig-like domain-containing protein [Eubacteriales bacterium]
MKKFIVYLLVIIVAVSLGFAVFYLVRDNEVISISSASIYKDAGDNFTIDLKHANKKSYTSITISTSNASVVSYDKKSNTFTANAGGVARVNFRTTNAKFRNLWCDVIVGDGTVESPFYISTPNQLAAIGMGQEIITDGVATGVYAGGSEYPEYTSDKCYKLVSSIDAKDINEGFWVPLRPFGGRFDGNGFTISNINIDKDKYTETFKNASTYDPTLFTTENVGLFQKVLKGANVYNLKLENVTAAGRYTNFGVITAENYGTIERIEVKDAYLSCETEVFGGLVAKNITTEEGENDTYVRHIARIDRCSINMTLGKKVVYVDDQANEVILGANGIVGGLVGNNLGGTIVYSYVTGEVAFGDDSVTPIVYGGLVANNTYITLTKFAGNYTSTLQGGNIKDCYSNLKTNFDCNHTNSDSLFAGAIATNTDTSTSIYKNDSAKEIVHNYLIGIYYNKDNLNAVQQDVTKGFGGIAKFNYKTTTFAFTEEKMIVWGLTEAEMKDQANFLSHTSQEIEFNDKGESLGIISTNIPWLFGTVWAIDEETNGGKPYLNYQLIYIPDDFATAGVPVIINSNKYTFEKGEIEVTPRIVSGTDGKLNMIVGETYQVKVNPQGYTFAWFSSDASVVSVDSNGVLTALKPGVVTITVSNKSGINDSLTVYVSKTVYNITNYPDQIDVAKGKSYTFSGALVIPTTTPAYAISNTNIASVSTSGDNVTVTGITAGDTYLTITAGDTVVTIPVKVSDVSDSVSIVLQEKYINVDWNGTSAVTGFVQVKSITNSLGADVSSSCEVGFYSSNTNVVTIDSRSGKYTVKGAGTASIGVYILSSNAGYTGRTTAYITVTNSVTPKPSTTLNLNCTSCNIELGKTYPLYATNSSQALSVYFSPTGVASYQNGVLTGLSVGTTTAYVSTVEADGTILSNKVNITVFKQNITVTLNLSATKTQVNVGDTVTVTAVCSDASQTLSWTYNGMTLGAFNTTNSSLATINQSSNKNATIKMNGAGSVTVSVSVLGVSKSITITALQVGGPYIYNAEQLNAIRNNPSKDYILAANIDLSSYNGGTWIPIGTKQNPFTGTIRNLGSFTISNININTGYDDAGLFGYGRGCIIDGLRINNATVRGGNSGAIMGTGEGISIANCWVSGVNVNGSFTAGGIAGKITYNSTIKSNSVVGYTSIIAGTNGNNNINYVGGIIGKATDSVIYGCKSNVQGNISLASQTYGYAGGIVGYTNYRVANCTVRANISANNSDRDYAGGIVGYAISDVTSCIVLNTSVTGYYAGGIGGALNTTKGSSFGFNDYTNGYRLEDAKFYTYSADVDQVAVKETVTIKGTQIGGLFGIINSGVVMNCYTRATLNGSSSNSVMGGFAAYIFASGFTNAGGSGNVGVVTNCYSACEFRGSGKKFAISGSFVHNIAGDNKASNPRNAGYCFNYLFDKSLAGNAQYYTNANLFKKDNIGAKHSTKDMKKASTYQDKGFSTTYWNLGSGYATLKVESSLL